MKSVNLKISSNELLIDPVRIGEIIGYTKKDIPEPVAEIISEAIAFAYRSGECRYAYRVSNKIRKDHKKSSLLIEGIIFNPGKTVYYHLKDSESIALFISTAGKTITDQCKKFYRDGDIMRNYIYDLVGSEMVEEVASKMYKTIQSEEDMPLSNIYSPGYCNWDVSEQTKLFDVMADYNCGVALTTSALMNPIKSLSGVIGIGRKIVYEGDRCKSCKVKRCTYRTK